MVMVNLVLFGLVVIGKVFVTDLKNSMRVLKQSLRKYYFSMPISLDFERWTFTFQAPY